MMTFEDLKLTKSVQKALNEIGFVTPTPIQQQAIPAIKSGSEPENHQPTFYPSSPSW